MPPGPFSPLLERTAPSGCVVNVSPNDVLNIRGYSARICPGRTDMFGVEPNAKDQVRKEVDDWYSAQSW